MFAPLKKSFLGFVVKMLLFEVEKKKLRFTIPALKNCCNFSILQMTHYLFIGSVILEKNRLLDVENTIDFVVRPCGKTFSRF